ncbi:restriction endonuclease subunit S [Clostridium baratii]
MKSNKTLLGSICNYSSDKVSTSEISIENYVSTENMLQDKDGITTATSLPRSNKVNKYVIGDILISNIRPYFKKIWFAEHSGGCSADVLILKVSEDVCKEYIYYNLLDDSFFDYVMVGSKGVKMPRGDKNQILKYELYLPSIEKQKEIVGQIKPFDDKIKANNKIIEYLMDTINLLYKKRFIQFDFSNNSKKYLGAERLSFTNKNGKKVPSGWDLISIADLVEDVITGDWGDDNQSIDTKPVYCIRGADIPYWKIGNTNKTPLRYVNMTKKGNKALINGDIMIEVSGGSPTQSTGRTLLIRNSILKFLDKPVFCSNFSKIIRPKKNSYSIYINQILINLYDRGVLFHYEGKTTGIKNLMITRLLENIKIVKPPTEILNDFNEEIGVLYDEIYTLGKENELLKATRDIMIKKLIK